MTRPHVMVVGGGLAGMAAALSALDDGAMVTLLERRPNLGGATRSFVHDGLTYDNGQHVFMRCCTEYRQFLDRIGSTDSVILQDRMDVPVLRPDQPPARLRRVALPAPLHLAPAIGRYSPLDIADRVRTVRTALALKRLDPTDTTLDDRTFAQWLVEHGAGQSAIDALWNLVCLPTVNLGATDASLQLAAKVFKTGLLDDPAGGDIGWSNVPLQQLHESAVLAALKARAANVRTRARVDTVGSDGHGPIVAIEGEIIHADAVIVAVPHDAAAKLLPPGSFAEQERVGELGRSAIVNVHLLYDRPIMDEPFVAGVGSPVQFVFDRTQQSGALPGQQMIAISLSAADSYLPWTRHELVEFFAVELAKLLPRAKDARVLTSMVTREVAATFRGAPGTAQHRPGPVTRLPGVFLAGAWTDTGWPATMEGAVRSGRRAAALASECAHTTQRGAAA
jgi:squalene-associated FAD-dependent desaturase